MRAGLIICKKISASAPLNIADRLGAGHVRVFAGGIPKGGTEVQAVDWAIEVYKPALDYAGTRRLENPGS